MRESTQSFKGEDRRMMTRRRAMRATGGVLAAGLAIRAAAPVTAQSGPNYGSWFEDVENFDGSTVDRRGQNPVTIQVGTEGNGGDFAFDPPAVRIDPGTTVVFEWASDTHNVLPESVPDAADWKGHEPLEDQGVTYEHTFDAEGIYTYYCDPHRSLGMKGAIVVGDQGASNAGGGDGTSAVVTPGLPGLLLGGMGVAVVAFLGGMFYGGRRTGVEQRSAALAGIGAAVIGGLFVLAVVAKLILGV